jgi:ribonuclease D
MHHIKKRRQLAVVKSLWESRVSLAAELDIAPGRLLSDAAISAIALSIGDDTKIESKKDLEKILRPIGLRPRWLEHHMRWISCIATAQNLAEEELPPVRGESDALPPVKVWREKYPLRYAALTHAKENLLVRSQELALPLENLISPEYVRRICWSNPAGSVDAALSTLGARRWQIEIATPILEAALLETEPLVVQEQVSSDEIDKSEES